MAIERDDLLGWLRRILSQGDSPEQKVHVIVLRYSTGTNAKNSEDVDTWEVRRPGSSKLLMDLEQVCDHIMVTCEKEADEIGGIVRFRLYAYSHPNQQRAVGTKRLRCYVPTEEDEDEMGGNLSLKEEGTQRNGRNLEHESHRRIMELFMKGVNDNQTRLRIENTDLREENRVLRRSYLEMIVTFERLKDESAARNIAQQESAQRQEIIANIGDKAMAYIPSLMNWYFKMPVMKEQLNPVEEMLKEVLMPLKYEQLTGIMSHLDGPQQAVIQKMYMGWIEAEEKKQLSAAKKLPAATPSNEKADTVTQQKEGQAS